MGQPGEVGCYLSHKKAIEQFLSTDAPYAIVFEDDAIPNVLEKTVATIIEKFLKHNNSASAVNLGAMDFKYSSKVLAIDGNILRCTHRFPMLATAVLWTRNGAKAFLENAYQSLCRMTISFDICSQGQTRRLVFNLL